MSKSPHPPILIAALSFVLLSAAVAASDARLADPDACVALEERCSVGCLGLEDQTQVESCLTGCYYAAVTSPRDDKLTLSSEDFLALLGEPSSFDKAACHSTTPCPSEYASCASWSGYSFCGDPVCLIHRSCGDDCEPWGPCFGDAMRQFKERFRVCFNAQGQSCTEYQSTLALLGCGC